MGQVGVYIFILCIEVFSFLAFNWCKKEQDEHYEAYKHALRLHIISMGIVVPGILLTCLIGKPDTSAKCIVTCYHAVIILANAAVSMTKVHINKMISIICVTIHVIVSAFVGYIMIA